MQFHAFVLNGPCSGVLVDRQTCNRPRVKSFFRYEWSDMSIQLSNFQVKAPSIHLKSCFQIDNTHAMSRFCIEWTMLWCTMWTVKHVTGQRWKQYDILKAVVLGWLKLSCIVTYQGAKCVFVLAVPSSTAELPALPYLHFWNVNRCPGQESYK